MPTLREMLEHALTDAMDTYAEQRALPHLRWTLITSDDGQVQLTGHASAGDYNEPDAAHAVRAWTAELDLEPTEQPVPGTVEARGQVEQLEVDVWGVFDQAAFENPLAERT